MRRMRRRGVLTMLTGLDGAAHVPALVPSAPRRGRSPSNPAKRAASGTIDSDDETVSTAEGELRIRLGGTAALPAKELARRIKDSARGDASC